MDLELDHLGASVLAEFLELRQGVAILVVVVHDDLESKVVDGHPGWSTILEESEENVVFDRGVMSTSSQIAVHDGLDVVDEGHVRLAIGVRLELL